MMKKATCHDLTRQSRTITVHGAVQCPAPRSGWMMPQQTLVADSGKAVTQ